MNYTEFIKKVDKASGSMPPENMAAFLHDYARSVPEYKREEFLERLFSFADKSVDADAVRGQDALGKEELESEITKMMERLEEIDNGEIMLLETLNEEYDEWYGDGEEFFYEDPENICETIQEGIRLVHECVDRELYQTCYELADFLLAMEIETEGEYEGVAFSLHELVSQNIAVFDYEAFVLEALLSAYWGNGLEERPKALYWMLKNSSSEKATLELMMQKSHKELEQFQEFLRLWMDYLGSMDDKMAGRLLREAVSLADSPDILLDAARKYVDFHPDLYVQALGQYKAEGQAETGLEIGKEALPRILSDRKAKEQAALLTAEFALQLGNRDEAEKCWLEAFRSVRSVVNYLRLVLEAQDYGKWQKAAEGICRESVFGNAQDGGIGSCQGGNSYYSLLFFNGKFQQMIAGGMSGTKALGWSGTFMKEGLALLFLYLYQGESQSLPPGCSRMCGNYARSISFDGETYFKGTCRGEELEGQQLFWELFCQWREHVQISEEEVQNIIRRLEEWVKLRVAGIMENNRRNYYGECAAFIAALGEVKESRGEPGAKARIMEEYRSEYSRRSAFHQELRAFGMRDARKRK